MDKSALSINDSKGSVYVFKASWISLTRPLTLIGSLAPIITGTIHAIYVNQINITLFIGLLIASIFIQAAVNMFNDYYDFRNGQDKDKWRITSKPIPFHQPSFQAVKYIAYLLLFIAMGIGLWLVYMSHIWILVVGITGIGCGIYYSFGTRSFSALGLGEIVAAVFLGIVPTNLAYVIQGHGFNINVFLVSLLFSLLISSMILTNNIRDLKKDAGFRKTIAIKLGRKKALHLLKGILSGLYGISCLFIIFDITPWQTFIVVLAIPLTWNIFQSIATTTKRNKQIGCMKWVAWHHWLFSILFITGLLAAL